MCIPSRSLRSDEVQMSARIHIVVEAEEKFFELAACPDSAMFETVDIK